MPDYSALAEQIRQETATRGGMPTAGQNQQGQYEQAPAIGVTGQIGGTPTVGTESIPPGERPAQASSGYINQAGEPLLPRPASDPSGPLVTTTQQEAIQPAPSPLDLVGGMAAGSAARKVASPVVAKIAAKYPALAQVAGGVSEGVGNYAMAWSDYLGGLRENQPDGFEALVTILGGGAPAAVQSIPQAARSTKYGIIRATAPMTRTIPKVATKLEAEAAFKATTLSHRVAFGLNSRQTLRELDEAEAVLSRRTGPPESWYVGLDEQAAQSLKNNYVAMDELDSLFKKHLSQSTNKQPVFDLVGMRKDLFDPANKGMLAQLKHIDAADTRRYMTRLGEIIGRLDELAAYYPGKESAKQLSLSTAVHMGAGLATILTSVTHGPAWGGAIGGGIEGAKWLGPTLIAKMVMSDKAWPVFKDALKLTNGELSPALMSLFASSRMGALASTATSQAGSASYQGQPQQGQTVNVQPGMLGQPQQGQPQSPVNYQSPILQQP